MIKLHTPRFKTILVIIGSIVVVGGISFGTFALLRQLKPAAFSSILKNGQSDNTPQQATGPDADRQRAEQLLLAGKLAEAKTAYQTAASGYTTNGNAAAAADATRQVAIIDATLKSQSTAKPQSYVPHQSGTKQ